jgi:hypothetical protein
MYEFQDEFEDNDTSQISEIQDKKTCAYIFTKGKSKGSQCVTRVKGDQEFCKKHANNKASKVKEQPKEQPKEKVELYFEDEPDFNEEIERSEEEKQQPREQPREAREAREQRDKVEDDIQDPEVLNIKLPTIEEEERQAQGGDNDETSSRISSIPTDDKEKIILRMYRGEPRLQDILPIESRTSESAEEWLQNIHEAIAELSSDSLVKTGFNTCTGLIEFVGSQRGFKLQGYSSFMAANKEVDNLLRLIKIKNLSVISKIEPEVQLGLLMGASAFQYHSSGQSNFSEIPESTRREPSFNE